MMLNNRSVPPKPILGTNTSRVTKDERLFFGTTGTRAVLRMNGRRVGEINDSMRKKCTSHFSCCYEVRATANPPFKENAAPQRKRMP